MIYDISGFGIVIYANANIYVRSYTHISYDQYFSVDDL